MGNGKMAARRRARARAETVELLQPLHDNSIYIGGIVQCGLGDWAEGPILLSQYGGCGYMAVEPIQRFCFEAWQAGFRGPIIQAALWKETGGVTTLQDFRSRTSMLDTEERRGPVEARLLTLDDAVEFVRFRSCQLLLWMDCEGVELEILKGAKNTLESTKVIVCELKDEPKMPGWPTADVVVSTVCGYGYNLWHRVADNGLFVRKEYERCLKSPL